VAKWLPHLTPEPFKTYVMPRTPPSNLFVSLRCRLNCMYTNTPDHHFLIDWHPKYVSVAFRCLWPNFPGCTCSTFGFFLFCPRAVDRWYFFFSSYLIGRSPSGIPAMCFYAVPAAATGSSSLPLWAESTLAWYSCAFLLFCSLYLCCL
jgi:hypothetical protein